MSYSSLQECLADLEHHGHLVRVKELVDPELEMAAIHLKVHEAGGPALLFENIKGTKYRATSNIFGTLDRSKFIFRKTLRAVRQLISVRNNPSAIFRNLTAIPGFLDALPLRDPVRKPVMESQIHISDLPLIKHWPMDGGAFVTLPQVYTENMNQPGTRHSNLGMYRIQLTGNDYVLNEEAGLHYQIHRGIGVHQSISNARGVPLKVSVFVGGPPAHTVAAVMPLPEDLSELLFAGVLGGRRFRYCYHNGYCLSTDADFVITGEVYPGENKPEGPFGDHLGYYSLRHPFPVMRVKNVFARKDAIWPFTVVGRPPQEDTSFGKLIHEITGDAIQKEIPGLKEVHAVDAAGVHPLLLAIGSERYTPYMKEKQPSEILTIANHILGTGQLSLAKFLFITADDTHDISTKNPEKFLIHMFERIDFTRDIHFQTNTTIDTLDYSGTSLNRGSKVIFAAYGEIKRQLCREITPALQNIRPFSAPYLVFPGVITLSAAAFQSYEQAEREMKMLDDQMRQVENVDKIALIVVCDNSKFTAENLRNFLWVTFTRCNPAADIYGVDSFYSLKHWGCNGPVIIDARIKPHHAPPLEPDPVVEKNIGRVFAKGGSLQGVIK